MAKLYPDIEIIQKNKPTIGELTLLEFLFKNYDDSYEIFFQPFLNGDIPDIVLMREGGGVMIFEVKDWDISHYKVNEKGHWIVKANEAIYKENPLKQVLKYKQNLYNLHIDGLLDLHLKDFKYWYIVNCAVYLHCQSTDEAVRFCLGENPNPNYKTYFEKNFTIIGSDSLNKEYFDNIFQEKWISKKSKYFKDEFYRSFSRYFKPSLHVIEQGVEINFSDDQSLLSESIPNDRKRIKGIAGSGKTLVLAKRAVNAHKRTNSNILILMYNITLRNYIHDMISSIRENFDWQYFHITSYHDFIKSQLNNVGIPIEIPANFNNWDKTKQEEYFESKYFSNLTIFEQVKEQLKPYEVVLIDETQDYKENWIRIIKKYFATVDAEIVGFADEKQNIYARDLETGTKMPVIPITTGVWDKKLNKNFRFSKKLALLTLDFRANFKTNK